MLAYTLTIQPVRAFVTIYIKADGSIENTNKIQRLGDVYTLTDNIYDSIVVDACLRLYDEKKFKFD
jgi:hypothetical protein